MLFSTEMAIGSVVVRRLGAKWFAGVLMFSFAVLFLMCDPAIPDIDNQMSTGIEHISAAINIVGLLLVTVVAATEIPYDISGRVLLVILSKPIRRYQYIAGKMLGVMAAGTLYAVICFLFSFGVLLFKGYQPDYAFVQYMIMAVLRIIAATGVAVFISASSSEVPTIAGCVGGGIFSFFINMVALMLLTSGIERGLQFLVCPLLYVLPSLLSLTPPPTVLGDFLTGYHRVIDDNNHVSDLDNLFAMKIGNLGHASVYVLIYLAIFLALSVLVFRKSEKME